MLLYQSEERFDRLEKAFCEVPVAADALLLQQRSRHLHVPRPSRSSRWPRHLNYILQTLKKETVDLKAGEKDVTSVTWSMGKFNSLLIMHTTSHFDHLSLLNVFIKDML